MSDPLLVFDMTGGSAPAGVTTVNTDVANHLAFTSEYGNGLYMRNDNTDGFQILGAYGNASFEAIPGRRLEVVFEIRDTVNGLSSVLGITTLGAGLADVTQSQHFGILHDSYVVVGNAVGVVVGVGSEPDDENAQVEVSGRQYTGILEIQDDGTAKGFLIDPTAPDVEIFLGTSKVVDIPTIFYTEGTPLYWSIQARSEWTSGNHSGLLIKSVALFEAPLTGRPSTSKKLMAQGRF